MERHGEGFSFADGVSCDGCHGPAEHWILDHAFKRNTWRLKTPLAGLNVQDQIATIGNALQRWAEVSVLTFERTDGPADLEISFNPSQHGDRVNFGL